MADMNQRKAVLEHLMNNDGITSIEAVQMYGATRLSGIIFELRKKYAIKTEMIEGKTRFGKDSRYAKYSLCDKEDFVKP